MASRPASRCSSLRLKMAMVAPSRANSDAMALPSPVPPPVTTTVVPSKVPSGSARAPMLGRFGQAGRIGHGQLPVYFGGRSSARAARSSA